MSSRVNGGFRQYVGSVKMKGEEMKAVKAHFTHYASIYGIPCYWNEETSELAGRNILFDYMIIPASHLQNFVAFLTTTLDPSFENPGFPIKLKGRIQE